MRSARSATSRSDIWALGVVLYDLLAHALPFDAESMPELCLKVTLEPPYPLRARRPEIPAGARGGHHAMPREGSCKEVRERRRARSCARAFRAGRGERGGGARAAHRNRHPTTRRAGQFAEQAAGVAPPPPYVSRASTPRTTTQDDAIRARKRHYAGVAAAVATTALVVGITVPLIVAYLEPDVKTSTPDATPVLQNASIAMPSSSAPGSSESAPVPSIAPAVTLSVVDAAPQRPATDAGRSFPQRPRPGTTSPPPPAASQSAQPGRHDDIPTMR